MFRVGTVFVIYLLCYLNFPWYMVHWIETRNFLSMFGCCSTVNIHPHDLSSCCTSMISWCSHCIVIQSSGQSVSSTGDWWPGAEVDVVSGHDIVVVYVDRGSDMFGVGLCLSHPRHDRNKKVSEEVDHKDRYHLRHDTPVYWLRQQWWAHQTNTLMTSYLLQCMMTMIIGRRSCCITSNEEESSRFSALTRS